MSSGDPASVQPFAPADIADTFEKPIAASVSAANSDRAPGAFRQ